MRTYNTTIVAKLDIYDESRNTRYNVSLARRRFGSVISTYMFKIEITESYEVIKTAAIHELGHVFGVPNNTRTTNVE